MKLITIDIVEIVAVPTTNRLLGRTSGGRWYESSGVVWEHFMRWTPIEHKQEID